MDDQEDIKVFFGREVEENLDALYGVAVRLTRDKTSAEDLVAETVTKAWSAIASLHDRAKFRAWIFRILRNTFHSNCRSRSPGKCFSDEGDLGLESLLFEQGDDFLNWWANPEKCVVNQLLGHQLEEAINALPEAFKVTILLVNVEGLTYDEAAEALGVPRGTVRSRMKRGRTLLQKRLWQQARDAGLIIHDRK
jgi:RNA polymerase sigma-70 factor (ECF subfamily)